MGRLEEMSDGYYVLEVTVGCITVVKAFKPANKPLDEISNIPKPDGFYLHIPDVKNDD